MRINQGLGAARDHRVSATSFACILTLGLRVLYTSFRTPLTSYHGTVLQCTVVGNTLVGTGTIGLEMRKWKTNRIEQVLVSNSSLVSGLSEASGVKCSWVEARIRGTIIRGRRVVSFGKRAAPEQQ